MRTLEEAGDDELDLDWVSVTLRANGDPEDVPPFLYKYIDASSAYFVANMRSVLVDSRLRLSARRELNDPFDAKVALRRSSAEDERLWFERAAKRQGIIPDSARIMAPPENWPAQGIDAVRETLEVLGIYSRSSRPDHPLMWAHYARAHTGIVLAFKHDARVFGAAYPVRYQEEFPTVSFAASQKFAVAMAIKGHDWKYEKEWRLLEPQKATQHIDIQPTSVSAVIFGARCGAGVRRAVLSLLAERRRNGLPFVEVFEVRLADDRFDLWFEPLSHLLDALTTKGGAATFTVALGPDAVSLWN